MPLAPCPPRGEHHVHPVGSTALPEAPDPAVRCPGIAASTSQHQARAWPVMRGRQPEKLKAGKGQRQETLWKSCLLPHGGSLDIGQPTTGPLESLSYPENGKRANTQMKEDSKSKISFFEKSGRRPPRQADGKESAGAGGEAGQSWRPACRGPGCISSTSAVQGAESET